MFLSTVPVPSVGDVFTIIPELVALSINTASLLSICCKIKHQWHKSEYTPSTELHLLLSSHLSHILFLSSLVSRPVLLQDYHNLWAVKHHKTIFSSYKKKKEGDEKKKKKPTQLALLPPTATERRRGVEVTLPVCFSNEHHTELIKTRQAQRKSETLGGNRVGVNTGDN